jgi:hypothetical protein
MKPARLAISQHVWKRRVAITCSTLQISSGVLVSLLILTASLSAQVPSVLFAARIDSLLSGPPSCPNTADFNGDGKQDLVTCGNTNTLWVQLGNGDGSFQPATAYVAGTTYATAVLLADFNGDGKVDLLSVNRDSTVSVLIGNGNGTFKAQVVTSVFPNVVGVAAVGDLNGDGKADLVIPVAVPQQGNSALAVLLGNGDGTFQSPIVSAFFAPSPTTSGTSIAVQDFNQDGKLDVVWSGAGQVSVFLGSGDGTIHQMTTTSTGLFGPIAVADFNGDGIPDVAADGEPDSTNVVVLLGNGDGTFRPQPPISDSLTLGNVFFARDFNGDGKTDLMLGGGGVGYVVWPGNGDGTFQTSSAPSQLPNGSGQTIGDFDGDGKPDLLIADPSLDIGNITSAVSVALGKGDGTFIGESVLPWSCSCSDTSEGSSILAGDINADGKPDIFLMQAFNGLGITGVDFLGNGNGAFQPAIVFGVNGESGSPVGALGDFNHDGTLDLAVAAGFVQIYFGHGDGIFQFQAAYGTGNSHYVAAADLNGDGNVDLVTADGNSISVLLGNADGTFGFATSFPVASASSLVVADFNHDGKLDIAAPNGNSIAVLLGNGDGTFGAPVNYGQAGTNVAVGEFNHDGNVDLVASNSTSNTVSVLLGNGDGTFRAPLNLSTGASPSVMAVDDFNGDGNDDIAVLTTGEVTVLRGNGDGTFLPAQYFGVSPYSQTQGMTAADLNGDGAPDLAISNGPTLLFNRPAGARAVVAPSAVNFGNQFVQTTSASATVTLSNPGRLNLTITSIQTGGTAAGDFSQTNTCGTAVPSSGNCTISLTFTPQAAGSQSATLTISDSSASSPQIVTLSGVGSGFGLSVASGGSNSVTVPAGQSANYKLAIGGAGYSGTVTITCSGVPPGAVCSVPESMNLSATTVLTFPVSVTTTARTLGALRVGPFKFRQWLWASAFWGAVLLGGVRRRPSRRRLLSRGAALLFLFPLCSCGGGSGGGTSSGTPAGSYTLNVKATSGPMQQSLPLTLTVQ